MNRALAAKSQRAKLQRVESISREFSKPCYGDKAKVSRSDLAMLCDAYFDRGRERSAQGERLRSHWE